MLVYRLRSPPAPSDKLPQEEVRSYESAEAEEEAEVGDGVVAAVWRWRVDGWTWFSAAVVCVC